MTRQREYYAACPKCGADAICPNCGIKVPASTPFSDWLRQLEYPLDSKVFSNHNLDFIWHNYRENWLITIEEKRNGGRCTRAQKDTHGVVSQMLENASGSTVQTLRGPREAEYRGHYVIRFEKASPDDSKWIKVKHNGNEYDLNRSELLHLLETGGLVKWTQKKL